MLKLNVIMFRALSKKSHKFYFIKAQCVDISADGELYAVGTTGGVLHLAKVETKVALQDKCSGY